MISDVRMLTAQKNALIHCITNPISINQCANVILAVGARPMMAEHPNEVEEITRTAGALLLNTGNITDVRLESMLISSAAAAESGIPFIADAVGAACSELRRSFITELLMGNPPDIIKGNYSEILALCDKAYHSSGVDADKSLDEGSALKAVAALAAEYGCTVLASGRTDIISDGKQTVFIRSGTPQLSCVTGTGCMLGALCAAYLSSADPMDAALTACAVMNISGELSSTDKGPGSFMVNLLDNIATIKNEDIERLLNMEVQET